ncbi:acyltransferase family protein [Herbaspirillum sp.]|uniref:acyltransferase family protein n=1 Tax=Herbaspirillum sp. TaxID=1890675 RepID=UPI0031E2DE87
MQREQWIDVFRGIGIVLVVWGHVYGGYSFDLIFLFHMPLFFFISGYLFQPVGDIAAFARRKAVQLLLPYAVFLLAINIPLAIDLFANKPHDQAAVLRFAGDLLLGGSRLSSWVAAFWFATSFYAVLLIEARLLGRYRRRTLLWLHAGMLLLSYANNWFFPDLQVPWALNVALAAAPFFYAGYLLRAMPRQRRLYRGAALAAGLACMAVVANRYFGWHLGLGYDMKVAHYGVPVLTFAAALACCVTLVRIARHISARHAAVARCLAGLGQAALAIMFMHMVFTMGVAALAGERYQFARFALGLAGSYLVYRESRKHVWSRALLLGSAGDFERLRRRWREARG